MSLTERCVLRFEISLCVLQTALQTPGVLIVSGSATVADMGSVTQIQDIAYAQQVCNLFRLNGRTKTMVLKHRCALAVHGRQVLLYITR